MNVIKALSRGRIHRISLFKYIFTAVNKVHVTSSSAQTINILHLVIGFCFCFFLVEQMLRDCLSQLSNKVPQTGRLIKNRNFFLTVWRLEVQGQGAGDPGVREAPLSSSKVANF